MKKLSHINTEGKAHMVDVGHKQVQLREAEATGYIRLNSETLHLVRENQIGKGDVLTVAEIAGIQAAKKTSELIPLCHPLQITKVDVRCILDEQGVKVTSNIKCVGQTGVEMEALTAVSVALLTIYDMCKAVDKGMVMKDVKLVSKSKKDIQ
jgi:cyclic pyranopterin monophosphate synthase